MYSATVTRQEPLSNSWLADSAKKGPAADTVTLSGIEIFVDSTTTDIAFCPKHTYKLHISIPVYSHILPPSECLLDTGAGLDHINAILVHET